MVAPNGDLWVTDDYNAVTWKYAAPISGNPSPAVTLTGIGGPGPMTFDPSGNLFIGDTQAYLVDEYAPPVSSGASPSLQVSNSPNVPMALLTDAAGNLYDATWQAQGCFCSTNLSFIPAGQTTPSAAISINPNDTNINGTVQRFLAFGANGIYVNDLGANSIDEFNPGLTAKIHTITTGINQPYALAVEP